MPAVDPDDPYLIRCPLSCQGPRPVASPGGPAPAAPPEGPRDLSAPSGGSGAPPLRLRARDLSLRLGGPAPATPGPDACCP
ncbi:unnamed protein product, partial [Staurois parvus]